MKRGDGLLIGTLLDIDRKDVDPTRVIQDTLIEAVGIVANIDFPVDEWRDFIEQTLSKLAAVPESQGNYQRYWLPSNHSTQYSNDTDGPLGLMNCTRRLILSCHN